MPGNPTNDPQWLADFTRRTGYGVAVRYYARHPYRALAVLAGDLRDNGWAMRPQNLSNFRREDGHPPESLTVRFASWSSLRSMFIWSWPAAVAVWYIVWIAGAVWLLLKGRRRETAMLGLGVAAMAIGEFCFASLTDACETYRHLLIFHLLTDITVVMAVGRMLTARDRAADEHRVRRRGIGNERVDRKGIASHPDPESGAVRREAAGEALTEAKAGRVLNCGIHLVRGFAAPRYIPS